MKGFLTVFYTRPAKTVYLVVIIILSYFVGDCQVNYFEYFSADKESFINAIAQADSFDYTSSYYFKNTVKNTVESIVKLTMEHPEAFSGEKTEEELTYYFESIGDRAFAKNIEVLKEVKGLSFAVVNHSKGRVYSSLKEINGADSGVSVRKYFGESGENLLIARSCRNPYFATNSFIEFAENIRDCAKVYPDNFDLYIRFGTSDDLNSTAEECRQLHFEMRSKIEKLNDTVGIYIGCIALVALLMLIVTGKQEPKGKTYLTAMNRIPNDLLIVMYVVVIHCRVALYRTSATVIINHGMELETLWFMRSEEFYISRTKYCVMIFIYTVVNLLCVLKRAYKTGTLLSNSYTYPLLSNLIKRIGKSGDEKAAEKTENT